jgi:hypothetical protein
LHSLPVCPVRLAYLIWLIAHLSLHHCKDIWLEGLAIAPERG